jgi:hypothetical protein
MPNYFTKDDWYRSAQPNYFIKDSYNHNLNPTYYDDTQNKDEWQAEVYEKARELADEYELKTVLDYGCGSAYKLLKHFSEFETTGVDLPQTVQWLHQTYPDRKWSDSQEPQPCDLLIASDVIEHMPDPDCLLRYIAACKPKVCIISTPERDLIRDVRCQAGPTGTTHAREWNRQEFSYYIHSRFRIYLHYLSNAEQATQVVVLLDPR